MALKWDANTEPELAGYELHYGPASRTYTVHLDVGNVTEHTLILPPGEWFIAATAYDIYGLKSDYSNEVVVIMGSEIKK